MHSSRESAMVQQKEEVQPPAHLTVESWSDKNSKIVVTQPEGFMCKLKMMARIDMSPDDVFDLLTNLDNTRIFRSLKPLSWRKVLADNGQGRVTAEFEQKAKWKFLFFSGTFKTRLVVSQDRDSRVINFRLAQPGFMKKFEGSWRLQPFTQSALDALDAPPLGPAQGGTWQGPSWSRWNTAVVTLQHRLGLPSKQEATLAVLEQSLMPALIPPPPFDTMLKKIAARQLQIMLEDLQTEVKKIKAGKGSLVSNEEAIEAFHRGDKDYELAYSRVKGAARAACISSTLLASRHLRKGVHRQRHMVGRRRWQRSEDDFPALLRAFITTDFDS